MRKNKIISILGTRGIPARYGGFETFAQELAKRLQSKEFKVVVFCEKNTTPIFEYEGVDLKYSKYIKSEHPLLFYFDCIRQATRMSDILLVTGTGGSLFYFIPKLANRVLVTNVDGIESRRGKWSWFKRMFIKITEYVSVKLSDTVIADSLAIKQYLLDEYHIPLDFVSVVEYGANPNVGAGKLNIINKYGLVPNEYYLVVSRLEPENNVLEIIEGLLASKTKRVLVVVGSLGDTQYVKRIIKVANLSNGRVRLVGSIYDRAELDAVRFYCYAYLHGHSVGGTNPSLLEALSAGNVAICHDNIFNREVTENRMFYFNSVTELVHVIDRVELISTGELSDMKNYALRRIASYYNWERIANDYRKIFEAYESQ